VTLEAIFPDVAPGETSGQTWTGSGLVGESITLTEQSFYLAEVASAAPLSNGTITITE
jgi:hypothetical protein